jgi:hypothetical protein
VVIAMTQINSFTGSILQSTQVQRQQSAAKDREVRQAREMEKNIAARDDEVDHQVESSEELKPIREERRSDHQRGRKHQHAPLRTDEENKLDLTA